MGALGAGRRALAAGLLAAGLLSADQFCGAAAAAETPIKFSLDFRFEGPSAPFLVPLDKGYYKNEGVNLTIEAATGSAESIARVASGFYDMGFADLNALIKYRDTGPPVPIKAVFMVYNRPAYAVIGRKSRGINGPKDLEGKTLGAPSTDISFAQWPIFAKVNGIDAGKVKIENISFPVREPMLAAGQIDAVTGFSFATFIDLKDKGVPVEDITVLLMADYGVDLYGSAIVVNPKFAADHADAVKGFLRAYLKGLKETVKSPATAVDAVLKRNDTAKKPAELERLKLAIRDNIVTPEVKANGFGGIDPARFEKAVDQLSLTGKWKAGRPKLDDIFDGSYLPAAAERQFK